MADRLLRTPPLAASWAHDARQEKLRPQSGWIPVAFATGWARPPRQQNSTSFWYAHTDQRRYETVQVKDIISPTGQMIDFNIRAERRGWLPSAPQLQRNPLTIAAEAEAAGLPVPQYVSQSLKAGALEMSCEDPVHPSNWPRNLFVWRSNLLGSSGKGDEHFLKHLLGTQHGVQGKDLGEQGEAKPEEAASMSRSQHRAVVGGDRESIRRWSQWRPRSVLPSWRSRLRFRAEAQAGRGALSQRSQPGASPPHSTVPTMARTVSAAAMPSSRGEGGAGY